MSERYTESRACQAVGRLRERRDMLIVECNRLLITDKAKDMKAACAIQLEVSDISVVLNELYLMRRQLQAIRHVVDEKDGVRQMEE